MFFKAIRNIGWTLTLLLAFVIPAVAEEPTEPTLPRDVNPLPADLAAQMKELIKNAEQYRGLKAKHAVPCGSLNKEGLKKKMLLAFEEELPAEKIGPLESALKAFSFIPNDMNLAKYYPDLLTSQVGGFYDPRRKYLVIIQNEDGLLGKEAKEKYGAELADRMEQTVMVHELTHSLQDQYFDLQKFSIEDPLSDEGAARTALIEGDATLTMYDFFSQMRLENMPGVETIMNKLFENPEQLIEMSADMPGGKEMLTAPAWFRDNLLFSYMNGFTFCINIKSLGGQKLLDYAFTKDPPRSTEQILHPEKWHTQRDDPIVITLPDLSKELPGYKKVAEGTTGEQSIKVLLRDKLKDEKKASVAAAGWGGDRYAVYAKDNERVLLWVTEWDSANDSREFKEAATALGTDWKVDATRPTRVQVVRGKLSDEQFNAVKAALADAKASVPENKAPDLAALGIKGGSKVAAGDNPEVGKLLEGLLKDNEGGGKDDLNSLLNDPNMQKLIDKLAGEVGKNGDAGGLDLGKMMKDPAVQEMMKGMLAQERPKGKASADGRSYTNEQLGFTIKLPESKKDWTLNAAPPTPLSLMISAPNDGVQISVVSQALPMALPIEMMGPSLEMGAKMMAEDYKKISAGAIDSGGKKGYELQYEGKMFGQPMRTTQRVFLTGTNMLVIAAVGPIATWKDSEAAVKETLDSVKFSEPKAAPAKQAPNKKEDLKEE